MKKVTKAQQQMRVSLALRLCTAQSAVFAAGPNNVTPLDRCWLLASAEVQEEYSNAVAGVMSYDERLIREGRAYRNALGTFTSN